MVIDLPVAGIGLARYSFGCAALGRCLGRFVGLGVRHSNA